MESRQEPLNQQRHGQDGPAHESGEVVRRDESEGWSGGMEEGSRPGEYVHELKRSSWVNGSTEKLAQGLGLFSIALGMAELAAPRSMAKLVGVQDQQTLLRLAGLREIASGVGILSQRRPVGWLWFRVAGDIMDLALLGAAFTEKRADTTRLAAATAAVAGVTALDIRCGQQLSEHTRAWSDNDGNVFGGATARRRALPVKKAIIVNRSPEELYRYWRDPQNLPHFMKNLESVEKTGEKRSHWVTKGPGGKKVEWDAEIVEDRPNELIAWRSVEGAAVPNWGSVRFEPAPGGRGTLVRVEMQYSPPGGLLGATIAKLFGRTPEQQIEEDLRRFKRVMETGEIITTEGQPAGRASSTSWKYDHAMRRVASAVSG